jgi:Amt family ammonium transporter
MDAATIATGLRTSADVLFLMLGAVMVFAMHAGFAFLEVGTVRKKSQVNALVKILTGGIAAAIFVFGFKIEQEKLRIDDVLGVWPLHGICGTWGGIAAGIFGSEALGGMGGVSFLSQLAGSLAAVVFALACGFAVYTALSKTVGIRLHQEDEFNGPDLAIHHIDAYPEDQVK